MQSDSVYVDGSNQILGRLASITAKLILSGKKVYVFNSEKILVSGNRQSVFDDWLSRLDIKSRVNPIYGPIHYRRPDKIFKRVVKGMVPRDKRKGKDALKRLKVFIGVPEEFSATSMIRFKEAEARRPVSVYVTMAELSSRLGWKGQ